MQGRVPGQRLFVFRAAPGTPAGARLAVLAGLPEAQGRTLSHMG